MSSGKHRRLIMIHLIIFTQLTNNSVKKTFENNKSASCTLGSGTGSGEGVLLTLKRSLGGVFEGEL